MNFYELAKSRYSVRNFSNKKISREEINKLLELSHLAPTGCNLQPQRILVIEE